MVFIVQRRFGLYQVLTSMLFFIHKNFCYIFESCYQQLRPTSQRLLLMGSYELHEDLLFDYVSQFFVAIKIFSSAQLTIEI